VYDDDGVLFHAGRCATGGQYVDVKAFLSIKDFDGINIYGRIVSLIGRSHFYGQIYGQIMGRTWRNVKNRTRRNAVKIVADYWRIAYLWADEIIYGRMKLFMGRCIIPDFYGFNFV
jgi:hypothetical protein